MDFTPGIQGKRYERIMFHAMHILRSRIQGFKPLTEAQYNSLCNKIENHGKNL
jgi:hypothetical protein